MYCILQGVSYPLHRKQAGKKEIHERAYGDQINEAHI